MRKNSYEENSYADNELDIAFIAQNSKEVADSSSVSMSEDNHSISAISKTPSHSPLLSFVADFSMDEWPSEKQPSIFKNNSIQEERESENSEQVEVEKPVFRKKRLGDKMKVITMKAKTIENNCYKLRSRVKNSSLLGQEDSNSSEQIRNLVEQLGKKEKIPINFFLKNTSSKIDKP